MVWLEEQGPSVEDRQTLDRIGIYIHSVWYMLLRWVEQGRQGGAMQGWRLPFEAVAEEK